MPALGQRFLPAEIVQAEVITEEMNDRILSVVEPPMFDLAQPDAEAKDITEARDQVLDLFPRSNQPSVAFLEALSAAISARINDAVEHESPLVRMNAMIILASMIDDESKPLIDKGIGDQNDGVRRWAVTALGRRASWWRARAAAGVGGQQAKIDAAIAQIQTLSEQVQPPHPIVISAGMDALLRINTPRSREALIAILNQRVELHAADPNLTYSPERSALERFTNVLVSEVPPDARSIKGYNQAMSRYASLIVADAKANRIDQEKERGVQTMLYLCFLGMANVSAAVQAPNSPPQDHNQARGWVVNGRWDELDALVNRDWRAILVGPKIGLKAEELAIKPAAE